MSPVARGNTNVVMLFVLLQKIWCRIIVAQLVVRKFPPCALHASFTISSRNLDIMFCLWVDQQCVWLLPRFEDAPAWGSARKVAGFCFCAAGFRRWKRKTGQAANASTGCNLYFLPLWPDFKRIHCLLQAETLWPVLYMLWFSGSWWTGVLSWC